jgi:signal transduction histidine kinase/ActR/RegA family two-component response regulator/PAS domain-containing protein
VKDAEDARVFRRVAWITALVVTVVMPVIALAQPDAARRAVRVIVLLDGMVLFTLWLTRLGRVRLASWIYVLVLISLITYNAPAVGGIRSPGVQAYFIFAMLAGLLLGTRVGILIGIVCALLALGLVMAEVWGMVPERITEYEAFPRWLLICVYMSMALLVMRIATERVRGALAAVQNELAERRATRERLDRALDAGNIGLFEHVPGSERFCVDDRALAQMGITAGPGGEIRLDAWLRLVHPDDRARVRDDLALTARGTSDVRTHYRLILRDGVVRHMEAAAHLVQGANGEPSSVFGMVMDVTDRKQGETERERLLVDLGERVKELGLLHEVGRMLQHASGVDRLLLAELAVRMPGAWQHADDACARVSYGGIEVESHGWCVTAWTQTATFATSEGRGELQVAYRHPHPAEHEGPFLAEERALIDSLAEMLRSHIERNVIERQRQAIEAQLRHAQKMDALGTLAGGIAHDFNNILTAIGGNAELAALEAPQNGEVAESIQEILKAHGRARDLVRRILLFSRSQEPVRQVTDLEPIVKEALQLLRATVPRNIDIRTSLAPNLPPVRVDATQMHQVMMNLGTNAAYAMGEGGGVLSVELDAVTIGADAGGVAAEFDPGRYLRLRVADTGCGMGPEVRERLFEPFFTTKGQAGTGLGLSVVHGIIRDHDGSISVTSEPGVGTQFEIRLPADVEEAPGPAAAFSGRMRGDGQHVMYVDDEASLCHVMSRTLARLGYRCTTFTDAVVALQEFRTAPHEFHAVITDLQMPPMSGLDVARAVRAIRPDTPIAVASGYPPEHIATDPDVESVAWIYKPATVEELADTLHRLVGGDGDGSATDAASDEGQSEAG